MFKTQTSKTADQSLDEFLSQLKESSDVDGILLMGSTANGVVTEYSDYDLVVIANNLPKKILGITTFIDNKFAEIFFYTPEEVKDLLAKEKIDPDQKEGWIINWSRDGKIIADKSGLLSRIKEKAKQTKDNVADTLPYSFWHKINYNFVQNKRYFLSGKEIYLEALDVRLLYSIAEVFVGYFNVRKIVWRGEKKAIQWLQENDKNFLGLFQTFNKEIERAKKMVIYEQLAQEALEPLGGLWKEKVTAVMPTGDFDDGDIEKGFKFWNGLFNNQK